MTPQPSEQPRTPTGRWVVEEWESEGGPDPTMVAAILKIEAEAANGSALDVPAEAVRKALAFVVAEFGGTILDGETWAVIRRAIGVEETATPAEIIQALGYEWEGIRVAGPLDDLRRYHVTNSWPTASPDPVASPPDEALRSAASRFLAAAQLESMTKAPEYIRAKRALRAALKELNQ